MNNKKIVGNGSKATLPNGQKLSDKIQENKTKHNIENNKSRGTGSTSTNNSVEEQENKKSKPQQTAQAAGTEAAKEALKKAAGTIPWTRWIPKGIRDKIIDKFMDSGAGQAAVEKAMRDVKRKIMMIIAGAIASIVLSILSVCVIFAVIASPVAAVADALEDIGDFFASMGNWFSGNGWCSGAECNQNAEAKYYDKLTSAVKKYSGQCKINEDLITATIFYGQMTKEEEMEYDNEETSETNNYFNYLDVKEGAGSPTAASQINKLIRVYLKGEDVDLDSNEVGELEMTDDLTCSASATAYKDYLIDTYIDWAYPSVVTETRTKEKISDEIMAMGNIYIGSGTLSVIEDTDGLFTMLPAGLSLGVSSQPASCRCHPTKHIYQSHKGVDIGGAPYGTTVSALEDGVVVYKVIATTRTCGSSILKLKHTTDTGETYYTRYVHLNRNSNNLLMGLNAGDIVTKGQVIGYIGGTVVEDSCSTGPHLHFEVLNSEDKVINPLVALNNRKNGLSILANQELITACARNGAGC